MWGRKREKSPSLPKEPFNALLSKALQCKDNKKSLQWKTTQRNYTI